MVFKPVRISLAACLVAGIGAGACGGDDGPSAPPQAGTGGSSGAAGSSAQGGAAQGGASQGGASQAGASPGGASQGGASQAGAAGSAAACELPAEHTGEATYYAATGAGNCSFDPSPQDLMVGAMNHTDYAASAVCGACVAIQGPDGTATVRLVDRCPECKPGDIDLSQMAFAKLADPVKGRVPISWRYVACPVQGPILYHFKDGSNPWWTAVQVRNHRYEVAKFEYLTQQGTFEQVPRVDYNFFVEQGGMGAGPYTFRVTDVHGHVLQDEAIPAQDNASVPGGAQFPACP